MLGVLVGDIWKDICAGSCRSPSCRILYYMPYIYLYLIQGVAVNNALTYFYICTISINAQQF